MKESFDKEIDSLLRRGAGAGAGMRAFGDGGGTYTSAHLDADELSAFAEGALPVAARAAAASHMADCKECRALAVDLARASGAEGELERRAVAASIPASASVRAQGRGWFSSLLAPRSLRFVAPVLALCLVAVVSFVALRSRRGEANLAQQTIESNTTQQEVAKNEPIGSTLSTEATEKNNSNSGAGVVASGGGGTSESRNASASAPSAKDEVAVGSAASPAYAEDKRADEPAPPAPAKAEEPAASAPPAMSKTGPPSETGEVAKENKEKSARQSQAEEEVAVNDVSTQQQQRRAANNQARGMDVQMPDGARNQKRGATENSTVGSGGSLASSAPKPDRDNSAPAQNTTATRRGRSEEQRGKNEDDELARPEDGRSVAGHRFRREGGAWVDVSYKPSMASTGVRRGTDAYRALVADMPEIGRIAEQLGGEVIVVVKGRAYRIR